MTIPYREFTIAFTKAKAPPAKGLTELKKGALFPHIFVFCKPIHAVMLTRTLITRTRTRTYSARTRTRTRTLVTRTRTKDQDFGVKDKDKDQERSRKDKNKDKDFGLKKQTSNTDTNTRPTTITNSCVAAVLAQAQRFSMPASQITINSVSYTHLTLPTIYSV